MTNLLLDEYPLIVIPSLASSVGLNEAIVLQQVHYWILKSKHDHDGHAWIYNSITSWAEQFPFWSESTIKRAINSLRKKGLLITGNYNKKGFDKTLWYRIDYVELDRVTKRLVQNDPMEKAKMTQPVPETTTETTTDIDDNETFPYTNTTEELNQSTEGEFSKLSAAFWTHSGIPEPSTGGRGWSDWEDGVNDLLKIAATTVEIRTACKVLDEAGYNYTGPASIVKTIVNGRKKARTSKPAQVTRPLPIGL